MKTTTICVLACLIAVPALGDTLPRAITDHDFHEINLKEVRLGQFLFYDPILSGNRNIACATCHHPKFGTADGVSLSFGDGGIGLGPERKIDPENRPEKRIPRNAPSLFNLGAKEFTVMFHDGRLEADPNYPNGLRTPMDADMVTGFASVLSAQTMFPVLSRDEMAGSYDENNVARAVRQGKITGAEGAWGLLSDRVAKIPAYANMFQVVYPNISSPQDIGFTDISNAIAAFMAFEWRSDTSKFDAVLRLEDTLDPHEANGMSLFFGDAKCATCHAGPFLTDHKFHAMAAPQIGPGKAASFEDHNRDEGRFRVTGDRADLYAFRTPSLRNIAMTAPYGHAGSHADLASFIADHVDPVASIRSYDRLQAILPAFESDDFAILNAPKDVQAIQGAVTIEPVALSEKDVQDLVAFLGTLTDPVAITGRFGIPKSVPSGLAVP
ncbi:MAG: cytochrome c peroxidase [Aliishimia sp.]